MQSGTAVVIFTTATPDTQPKSTDVAPSSNPHQPLNPPPPFEASPPSLPPNKSLNIKKSPTTSVRTPLFRVNKKEIAKIETRKNKKEEPRGGSGPNPCS